MGKRRTGGRVSGTEGLACVVVSGRRMASRGFVKICLPNFAEGWVWFKQLPQGFAQRVSSGRRRRRWEIGKMKKARGAEQRAGWPSQSSVGTAHRPTAADLRNTTPGLFSPRPFPPFYLSFHPPPGRSGSLSLSLSLSFCY